LNKELININRKKNRRRELCFKSEKLTGEEKKRGGKRREKGER
jgi:hypothetical protein